MRQKAWNDIRACRNKNVSRNGRDDDETKTFPGGDKTGEEEEEINMRMATVAAAVGVDNFGTNSTKK